MTERKKFIDDYLTGEFTVTELCGRYGISRKNGHTWIPSCRRRARCALIFGRNGLIRPKRRRRKTPPFSAPLAHAKAPNTRRLAATCQPTTTNRRGGLCPNRAGESRFATPTTTTSHPFPDSATCSGTDAPRS